MPQHPHPSRTASVLSTSSPYVTRDPPARYQVGLITVLDLLTNSVITGWSGHVNSCYRITACMSTACLLEHTCKLASAALSWKQRPQHALNCHCVAGHCSLQLLCCIANCQRAQVQSTLTSCIARVETHHTGLQAKIKLLSSTSSVRST